MILDFRTSDAILNYVNGKDVARYAGAGVITPDHVIRTKNLAADRAGAASRASSTTSRPAAQGRAEIRRRLQSLFRAQQAARAGALAMHDPLPRVVLVPGLGLFGLGASAKDARIAADIAEAAVEGITGAEGDRPLHLDFRSRHVRHRILAARTGQAGRAQALPLAGQVAVITGAGGAIGAATAAPSREAGAEVALLDLDVEAAHRTSQGDRRRTRSQFNAT